MCVYNIYVRKNVEEIVIDKKNIYMYIMVYVCTDETLRTRTGIMENKSKFGRAWAATRPVTRDQLSNGYIYKTTTYDLYGICTKFVCSRVCKMHSRVSETDYTWLRYYVSMLLVRESL